MSDVFGNPEKPWVYKSLCENPGIFTATTEEKYDHVRKRRAMVVICQAVLRAFTDPSYDYCRRRLAREFLQLALWIVIWDVLRLKEPCAIRVWTRFSPHTPIISSVVNLDIIWRCDRYRCSCSVSNTLTLRELRFWGSISPKKQHNAKHLLRKEEADVKE